MRRTRPDGGGTDEFDVHRVGIGFTINSHGFDTELSCGSDDPACDLTPIRREFIKSFGWCVIGGVPVGYEDLVEMRFVVGRALKMIRYDIRMNPVFIPDNSRNVLLTCRCEVPGGSGKVRTRTDYRVGVRNRESGKNPRRCMR